MKALKVLLLLAFGLSGLHAAQAQQRLRLIGEIVAAAPGSLTVKTRDGQAQAVRLADQVRVVAVSQVTAAPIRETNFVAVTAVPQADGSLLASVVNIFAESMRGLGEGHYPMANLPGSTMTNATVATIANTMTNATVAAASDQSGARRVALRYKGGEKFAVIPANLPVTLYENGDRSLLTPGAQVVVNATRGGDGALVSASVSVGKNGSLPSTLR